MPSDPNCHRRQQYEQQQGAGANRPETRCTGSIRLAHVSKSNQEQRTGACHGGGFWMKSSRNARRLVMSSTARGGSRSSSAAQTTQLSAWHSEDVDSASAAMATSWPTTLHTQRGQASNSS